MAVRSRAISRSSAAAERPLRCRLGSRCPARVRRAEARSRRDCGDRALNDLGTRIRSRASTGTGKSIAASRLTCRSAVSTSGRGPSWWSKPRWPLLRPHGQPRVEDQGEPRVLAGGHVDDVAGPELLQRPGGLGAALVSALPEPAPSRGPSAPGAACRTPRSHRGGRSSRRRTPPGPPRSAGPGGRCRPPSGRPGTGRRRSPAARASGAARTGAPG